MKRLVVGLPLVLLVSLVLVSYWVLHTDAGASWVWSKIEESSNVAVTSSRTDGSFSDGFRIQQLEYRSAEIDVLVGHAEIKAGPGWWPLSIQVWELSLTDVSVIRHPLKVPRSDRGEEADISAILTSLKLPLPIEVHKARLGNISLQEDGRPPLVLAESLRLGARLDEQLSVHQFDIQGPQFEAGIHGRLALEPPHDLTVSANVQVDLSGSGFGTEWVVPFTLEGSGNIGHILFDSASPGYGLKLEGELHEPFTEPAWVIRGGLDRLVWPPGDDGDGGDVLTLTDATLESRGSIDDWSVALGSLVRYGDSPETRLALSGLGSGTGIHITNAGLEGKGVDLGISGRLDWSPEVETSLAAVIQHLDLSPWLADWPAGERLTGELELVWSGAGLEIPRGELRLIDSELEVNLEADVDIDANSVDAHLEWTGLAWPLRQPDPDFASRSGELSVNGNLDQWSGSGRMELQLGDYPGGELDVEGEGGRTSAHLRIPGGEVLGGHVSGEASIDWMDGLSWDADIRTNQVDPEPLLPGWPGRLDIELAIEAENQARHHEVDLKSVTGQLRGVDLEGKGGLIVTGDQFSFDQFELRTNEARLWLDGRNTGPDGLSVSFDGNLPSMLLQGANGRLQLEGRYSSHVDHPALQDSPERSGCSDTGG
jgi:autotransporter translocation and assembly factor TamB